MKVINILIFAAFILTSCSTFSVNCDYDTEFDFTKFRTFKIVNKASNKAEAKKPTSIAFNRVSRAEKELKLRPNI